MKLFTANEQSGKVSFLINTSVQNLHLKQLSLFPNILSSLDLFISVSGIFRILSLDYKLLIIFIAQWSPSIISSL